MIKSIDDLKAVAAADRDFADHVNHRPNLHTHSGVSTYATCEQKWWLRYVLGLNIKRTAKHFIVGNLVHNGLERLLKVAKGIGADPLLDEPLTPQQAIDNCLNDMGAYFEKEIDRIQSKSDMLSGHDCDMAEYCRVQALAMVKVWAQVKLKALCEWVVIDVERAVTGIESAQFKNMRELEFWKQAGGKIDCVVKHPTTGRTFILEHKTRSRMDTFNVSGLVLDQQANWYMAMYEKATGTRIDGFLYNVIKKPQHRMSAKGSDDLEKRMTEAMLADTEGYMVLEDVIADRSMIDENIRNMALYTGRMNVATPKTIARNTSMCSDRGGCPYKMLCQGGAVARDLQSIARQPDLCQYSVEPVNSELVEVEEDI